MPFDPGRAIADLHAIAELTGGRHRRRPARLLDRRVGQGTRLLHDHQAATGAQIDRDEAGNVWAYLRGSATAS